jgi:hypothetical protein
MNVCYRFTGLCALASPAAAIATRGNGIYSRISQWASRLSSLRSYLAKAQLCICGARCCIQMEREQLSVQIKRIITSHRFFSSSYSQLHTRHTLHPPTNTLSTPTCASVSLDSLERVASSRPMRLNPESHTFAAMKLVDAWRASASLAPALPPSGRCLVSALRDTPPSNIYSPIFGSR